MNDSSLFPAIENRKTRRHASHKKGRVALVMTLTAALTLGGSGATALAAVPSTALNVSNQAALAAAIAPGSYETAQAGIIYDSFKRSVTGGWGSPEAGGAYQLLGGPSSFSVGAKGGSIDIPAAATSRQVNVPGQKISDGAMSMSFSVPSLPTTGAGLRVGIYERQIGDRAYRAIANLTPSGTVELSIYRVDKGGVSVYLSGTKLTDLNPAAGTNLTLDFTVTGTDEVNLSARIYKSGIAAPEFQTVAKDSSANRIPEAGVPGLWFYTSGGSSAAKVNVTKITADTLKPYVAPNVIPVATFGNSSKDLLLSADGSGSVDSDGTITSYLWDFGDGATATGAVVSHSYAATGTYPVTLTVTDNSGATATVTNTVSVLAANVAPVAAFSSKLSDLKATLNATTSKDSDGSIVSYLWDFGDGATATGAIAEHSYSKAGSYPVTLTVTDDRGGNNTVSSTVIAKDAPVVAPPVSTLKAGADPIGSARFAIPAGAIFVSPNGNDNAKGTEAAPVKTINKGLSLSAANGTVVVRAGSYHENVGVNSSKTGVTLQNYPGEAVWLDGAETLSGFSKAGNNWATAWNYDFDHSPTFTRGAPDNTKAGWDFINKAYPLAAYPEQTWIDGKELTQVATEAEVKPGTFYADFSGNRLVIGDNPSSKKVTASTLQKALTIRTTGATIQGIGVKNYAPSMPDMGAVRVDPKADGANLRQLVISNNSTMGLSVSTASNVKLDHISVNDNGFIGFSGMYDDGLTVSGIDASGNNTQKFNAAPAAGGFKLVRSRNVSVDKSTFNNNVGMGLWFDESVYNATVTNSVIKNNSHHGLMFELSEKVTAVNNYVSGNAQTGIKLYSTGGGTILNNTVLGNKRGIDIVQDTRVASDISAAGHDPRQALPDPTVPWLTKNIQVSNNIVGNAITGTDCLICSQDNLKKSTGKDMGIVFSGNLLQRSTASAPKDDIRWANVNGSLPFPTLAAFNAATGQKAGGDYIGSVNSNGLAPAAVLSTNAKNTVAIPAALAAKTGLPAAGGVLGATVR